MVACSQEFKPGELESKASSSYAKKYLDYLSRGGNLSLPAFEKALSYHPSEEELKSAETLFVCGKISSPLGFKGPSDAYQHKTLAGLIHTLERENAFWCSSYSPLWSLPRLARELELLRDYSLPERVERPTLELVSEYVSGGHWV